MYRFIEPEVAGGLAHGNDFAVDADGIRRVSGTLHYEFAGWMGDDIVTTSGYYLVSGRLAQALEAANLTGFELADVVVTKSAEFAGATLNSDLPDDWRRLIPTGSIAQNTDFALDHRDLVVNEAALEVLQQYEFNDVSIEGEPADAHVQRMRKVLERARERQAEQLLSAPAEEVVEMPSDDASPAPTTSHDHLALALAAVGTPSSSEHVTALFALVNATPHISAMSSPPGEILSESKQGLEVQVTDGSVSSVIFQLDKTKHHGAYPYPDDVVPGLALTTATHADFATRFGEPFRSMGALVARYRVGGHAVQALFSKTGLAREFTVLRDA